MIDTGDGGACAAREQSENRARRCNPNLRICILTEGIGPKYSKDREIYDESMRNPSFYDRRRNRAVVCELKGSIWDQYFLKIVTIG